MEISKKTLVFAGSVLLLLALFSLYSNKEKFQTSENHLTNAPEASNQPYSITPHPSLHAHIPPGAQVIRSLLGLEVTFMNGHIDYAGLMIVKDPRYQALVGSDKLVDSIIFKPSQGSPFLLLIAIAKGQNGSPIIIPGKFDIIQKTDQNGFVLRDTHGRMFYYSGYILPTPLWQNLQPGQSIRDQFCKAPNPLGNCSAPNTVTVNLLKATNPLKDVPYLGLVK